MAALHSAQQCVYALDDFTVKVTKDPTLYAQQAQRNCRVWSEIARTLNARRAMLGRKQVVLFHCYGGIHRSPAALAACLMAREGFQAQLGPTTKISTQQQRRIYLQEVSTRPTSFCNIHFPHKPLQSKQSLLMATRVLFTNLQPTSS